MENSWLRDPARDWSATRAAVVRPANAQSAQLPTSCSHARPWQHWPSSLPHCLCTFRSRPPHGHIASAASAPARLPPFTPSTMADSIRGDGVLRAHRALDALLDDPERLQRDRERFSRSPPAYRSQPSGSTTRSPSPDGVSDDQKRRDSIRLGLKLERYASHPTEQYLAQHTQETERLDADRRRNMYRCPPGFNDITEHAQFKVKARWIEQGIWREEWDTQIEIFRKWKHEEPLPESKSDSDSGSAPVIPLFGTVASGKQAASSHKVDPQEQQRQREASRPYFQFIAQLSHERDRIEALARSRPPKHPLNRTCHSASHMRLLEEEARQWSLKKPVMSTPHDINTTAYERLKSAWTKRGIWNNKWGVLPGMSWKHEEPFEEMLRERLLQKGLAVDDPDEGEPEKAEEAPRQISADIWTLLPGSIFGPDSVSTGRIFPLPAVEADEAPRRIAAETRTLFSGPIFGPDSVFNGPIFPVHAVEADGKGGPPAPQRPHHDIFMVPRGPSPKAGSRGSAHSEPEQQPEGSSQAPSPPVRQSSRRDRAAKPKQPAKLEAAPLRAVRSGRVSKSSQPKQPARPKESAGLDVPATNLAPTPLRRSPRFQVASQGRQAQKLNGVPDQPSPVRRGTKQKTGGIAKTYKPKSVGVAKRGRRKSDQGRPRELKGMFCSMTRCFMLES